MLDVGHRVLGEDKGDKKDIFHSSPVNSQQLQSKIQNPKSRILYPKPNKQTVQIENFLELYQQGQRNFAYADLSGMNLTGVNLRDIDLTGANLTDANLSWACLNNATLTGACLCQADLRSAILNNANLSFSDLSRAKLQKADLRLATLSEAQLSWAIAQDAEFSSANLQNAKLAQSNLERAKLNRAYLVGAQLTESNLNCASLICANLSNANLQAAHLEAANLREAILVDANLAEANLSTAYLRGANLSQADLHQAILAAADLTEANLSGADLSRANLISAYLLKTSLRKAYLLRSHLQEVYLLQADLTEANLHGADLRRADLSGAYLLNTTLSQANLSEAFLLQTHLIGTNLNQAQMTGCCIDNWHVEGVDLSTVECSYVFKRFDYVTKRCSDRVPAEGNFLPGEFSKQHKQHTSHLSPTAIEIHFPDRPNWEALVFTLTKLELDNQHLRLTVHSYQKAQTGYLLVLAANQPVNAKTLAQKVLELYPSMLQLLHAKREAIFGVLQLNKSVEFNIKEGEHSNSKPSHNSESIKLPLLSNEQNQIYQQVIEQIQSIIFFQSPQQLIHSVTRLLNFVELQKMSLGEINQTILASALLIRAKKDTNFHQQMIHWSKTAPEVERFSKFGKSVRLALENFK